MKTVITGNSNYVENIASMFKEKGFDIHVAETPKEAKAVVDNCPVVLVSNSNITPFLTDRQYAKRLIRSVGPLESIIMLLDRDSGTPPYIWKLVLQRAIEMGIGKRHVYVLSRSVGSRMSDLESLYTKARANGVTFIKYEDVDVSVDNDEDYSLVTIDDGFDSYTLETPLLIECKYSADKSVSEYVEALRLRTYGEGMINSDRWFLLPGQTSRRNVFYIDAGLVLSVPLEDIVRSIANEIIMSRNTSDKIAHIEVKKCAFCYTCYRVCPHGALIPDNSAHAMDVLETNCTGCGICASICPANAIEIRETTDDSLPKRVMTHESELQDVETQSEAQDQKSPEQISAKKQKAIAFCCENSASIAAKSLPKDIDASFVSVPCGGNIDEAQVISALKEHNQVIIAVCPDNACKHYDGNRRALLKAEKIRKMLISINKDPERIRFVQLSHAMPSALHDVLD